MKVAIFGATGRIGKHMVKQALARGIHVTALVRNPDSLSEMAHENLKVVKADVFNSEELIPHIREVDYVLSCLGPTQFRPPWGEDTLFTASSRAAIDAMKATGKTRYCVMSSASVGYDSQTKEPLKQKIIINFLTVPTVNDLKKMEKYLNEECPEINFTVFRGTELLDDPEPWDIEPIFVENVAHDPEDSYTIPRANVAKVMLDSLEDEKLYRKSMYLSMPKKK